MNIYDFDGTIYHGDSTFDFFRWSLKKHPALMRYLPCQAWGFLLYGLRITSKTKAKETFYRFLRGFDARADLKEFWDTHEHNIYPYYRQQHADTDIVISASPEFLLEPICQRLGIRHLMASRVDPETGLYTGVNCHGAEKVTRLHDQMGVDHCDSFYSDAHCDLPLAKIADQAFLVDKQGTLHPWDTTKG